MKKEDWIARYPESKAAIEHIESLCDHFTKELDKLRIKETPLIRSVSFDVLTKKYILSGMFELTEAQRGVCAVCKKKAGTGSVFFYKENQVLKWELICFSCEPPEIS